MQTAFRELLANARIEIVSRCRNLRHSWQIIASGRPGMLMSEITQRTGDVTTVNRNAAFCDSKHCYISITRQHSIDRRIDHRQSRQLERKMKTLATGLILALALATTTQAATVSAFSENFEGTLAAWTDRNPGNPESAIFADPLRAGNHVLGFNQRGSAGSIYTTDFVTTSGQFTVSFEYLGLTLPGTVPGDSGGFFGISQAFPGNHYWVAGSQNGFGQPINLIDDGAWHTYNLTFNSPIGQTVHLMFEDFVGSGGVVGDVFFDNVRFNDSLVAPAPFASVPEPSGLALFALAGLLGSVGATRRRKTRANQD